MKITAETLEKNGVNPNGRDYARFESRWPDGLEVTPSSVDEAVDAGINADWAVNRFFSGESLRIVLDAEIEASKAYNSAFNAAFEAYARDKRYSHGNEERDLFALYDMDRKMQEAKAVYNDAVRASYVRACEIQG